MNELKPIRTDGGYNRAMNELKSLWGAKDGTPESDRPDALAALIDVFESEHFPSSAHERALPKR